MYRPGSAFFECARIAFPYSTNIALRIALVFESDGSLGPVLRMVAYVNPLAYGVDLLKHALLGAWTGAGYGGELSPSLDVAALGVFAVLGLLAAEPLLAREGGVTRTAFRGRA